MGYSIFIGQRSPILGGSTPSEPCVPVTHPDAPRWDSNGDDVTEDSNCRQPAYSVWKDFAKTSGTTALWDELVNYNTPVVTLLPRHLATLRKARKAWETRHPDKVAGWIGEDSCDVLARLVWCEWWIAWALKNCPDPAIGVK